MIKKHFWLASLASLFLFIGLSNELKAQQERKLFMGGGMTLYSMDALFYPAPHLHFRYNLKNLGKQASTSMKFEPAFILQFSNVGNFILVDLPLSIDVNIGHGSVQGGDFPIGAYAGIGFQGSYTPVALSTGFTEQFWFYGPEGHLGLRGKIAGRTYYLDAGLQLAYSQEFLPIEMLHLKFGSELF